MTLVCPKCEHINDDSENYCSRCGASLRPNDNLTPIYMRASQLKGLTKKQTTSNLGFYAAPSTVYLYIEGSPPLTVHLHKETTLGRAESNNSNTPDIDLTDFHAVEQGVSRIHAVIENQGNILTLTDLHSTNGTYLNGQKLSPSKPRILKSNDEIRLGGLIIHLKFDEV